MSRLRVAVVGAGHLGRIHAKLLGQVEGAELVAISDPFESARKQASEQFGVRTVADYRDLISDVDAAIIAAPTDLHFEIARDLLKAGKHLLVEKPLTHRSEEANQLSMMASAKRLTLQVGHVERFNPAFTALGDIVVDVKYVEAVRASRFPGRCLDVGVVMDLMIHDIDLVLSMTTAPVSSISASGVSVVSNHEDIAETRIEFECGLVANLKASRVSPTPARQMQVYGSGGFADIDFGTPALSTVLASDKITDRSFVLSDETDNPLKYADQLFGDHLQCSTHALTPRNAILDELHDFVLSITTGAAPTVSGADGARAVVIADQVIGAIKKRRWYSDASPRETGHKAYPRERIETRSQTQTRRAA